MNIGGVYAAAGAIRGCDMVDLRILAVSLTVAAGSLAACANTGVPGGGDTRYSAADCQGIASDALLPLNTALGCVETVRQSYHQAALGNRQLRGSLRQGTLVASIGALANTLTDGADGATTALGLIAGTSATFSTMIAPPARVPIYLDGQQALVCVRRAVQPYLVFRQGFADVGDDQFVARYAALEAELDALALPAGLVGRDREEALGFVDGLKQALRANRAVRDAVVLADLDTRLSGERVYAALQEVDLAVELRLHRLDVAIDATAASAGQSTLALAAQLTQRPDLFQRTDTPAPTLSNAEVRLFLVSLQALITRVEDLNSTARRLQAFINLLGMSETAADMAHCVDLAAGRAGDALVLRQPPATIDLADASTHTIELDVEGGNAPYSVQWVGSAPDGLTLETDDSGAGQYTVTADPAKLQPDNYQLILRDEDLRPLVVTLRVTGAASAQPPALVGGPGAEGDALPATPRPFTINGEAHQVCVEDGDSAGSNADVRQAQELICRALESAADFGYAAGQTFLIDGKSGTATLAAARLALAANEPTAAEENVEGYIADADLPDNQLLTRVRERLGNEAGD